MGPAQGKGNYLLLLFAVALGGMYFVVKGTIDSCFCYFCWNQGDDSGSDSELGSGSGSDAESGLDDCSGGGGSVRGV